MKQPISQWKLRSLHELWRFCTLIQAPHTARICFIHSKFHHPVSWFSTGYKITSFILPASCVIPQSDMLLLPYPTTWELNVTMLLFYSLSLKSTCNLEVKTSSLVPRVFKNLFQVHYEIQHRKNRELVLRRNRNSIS